MYYGQTETKGHVSDMIFMLNNILLVQLDFGPIFVEFSYSKKYSLFAGHFVLSLEYRQLENYLFLLKMTNKCLDA